MCEGLLRGIIAAIVALLVRHQAEPDIFLVAILEHDVVRAIRRRRCGIDILEQEARRIHRTGIRIAIIRLRDGRLRAREIDDELARVDVARARDIVERRARARELVIVMLVEVHERDAAIQRDRLVRADILISKCRREAARIELRRIVACNQAIARAARTRKKLLDIRFRQRRRAIVFLRERAVLQGILNIDFALVDIHPVADEVIAILPRIEARHAIRGRRRNQLVAICIIVRIIRIDIRVMERPRIRLDLARIKIEAASNRIRHILEREILCVVWNGEILAAIRTRDGIAILSRNSP